MRDWGMRSATDAGQTRTAEKSASSATSMYGTLAAMAASRTLLVSFHWNGPAVWITRSKPCSHM